MKELRVKPGRIRTALESLGAIGRGPSGGLDRTAFSAADREGREWLKAAMRSAGLAVRTDEAANIWGLRRGEKQKLPPIACGSHIDTVPSGGKYDGALGVILALEAARVLAEHGVSLRRGLEVVSFSAEEPNGFGLSTFGSRAAAGKLKRSVLDGVRGPGSVLLTDALREAGGDPLRFEEARLAPGDLAAYLEVHIEQGRRLEDQGIPVGIVTAITGIYREEVTVTGEANHAGTTLMRDRKDALMAAAELMLAFEAICRDAPAEETVGTIGRIANHPNAANIIPGVVQLHLEVRGASKEAIAAVLDAWRERAGGIARARGVRLQSVTLLDQPPVPMDGLVAEVCRRETERLGIAAVPLGSMAGHDAAHMAAITRAGMLFVPSIGGRSHCPEEESRLGDIEQAGNVLLHALLALDRQL
ncbi:M20 family metallo-hydrolase [Paenibacillus caseinilyticus]|uniref:Allantoate amidohydrolase n=1 Tax=Paenibacillus mucilaginosus K02 TaxID=997761 RepID=I0BEP6_9BACL|nr:M20 family metallo-hydrolase [Paenibacillus mucilaginosus]AFH60843.1 allantoate amidohydrolase [Paenibacillus mucilaginosus K02]